MASQIVTNMFTALDDLISEQVTSNFQTLMQIIFPIWSAGVLLFIVYVAWEILYGNKEIIVLEVVKHVMSLSLVAVFMGAGGAYLSYVVPFVQHSGQEIASALVGGDGGNVGNQIDGMIDRIYTIISDNIERASKDGGLSNVGIYFSVWIANLILLIGGGVFVLYCAAYLIMAMMMIGILLSLGGVFIGFAAFSPTRQMFTAWVGSCFNYIFLNVGYAILFTILIKYVTDFANDNAQNENSLLGIVSLVLVFAIGVFLLQQVATLMSLLTGGVGINGLVGAVTGFAKGAGSLGKGAGKGLGKLGDMASSARQKAWSGVTNGLGKGG
ncbi:trbL/VirB6 plasmid conjugal transfer family protein (plasmid) [Yersinia frederiksenii Y225]|nr:trbL/VirB6 plasmid conjugal transfer family protein [Yersinia frederiksenii Y225]